MIDLVFQNSTDDKSFKDNFFIEILRIAAEELKLENIGVSLNLVEEDVIRDLNKKYRSKDKVTDVLSFPMSEKSEIGDRRSEIEDSVDIGDIFICLSFAKNQAKSENISIDSKLAQLTVHGFLHLAGYDHEKSEEEEGKMFALESKIINKLSIQK